MNDRRPEPGSPWHRQCADAFPREWLDENRELPAGFSRAAESIESDLITGRVTEASFLRMTGRPLPPLPLPPKPGRKPERKLSPVVRKLKGWNQFMDGLVEQKPRLTPLAVALWCWLWKCENDGFARTSERKLSDRFGIGRTAIRARLRELIEAGFLSLARRGTWTRSTTVYRVRPIPRRPGKTELPTGSEIDPLPGPK